jgi:hypothetical protein
MSTGPSNTTVLFGVPIGPSGLSSTISKAVGNCYLLLFYHFPTQSGTVTYAIDLQGVRPTMVGIGVVDISQPARGRCIKWQEDAGGRAVHGNRTRLNYTLLPYLLFSVVSFAV